MRILMLTVLISTLISNNSFAQVGPFLQFWVPENGQTQSGWVYAQYDAFTQWVDTLYICGRDTVSLKAGQHNTSNPGWSVNYFWNTGETTQTISANQSGQYVCTITTSYLNGPSEIVEVELDIVFTDLDANLPASIQMPLCVTPIEIDVLNAYGGTGNIEYAWSYYGETELGPFNSGYGNDIIYSLEEDTLCTNSTQPNLLVYENSDTLLMRIRISDDICTFYKNTTILPASSIDPITKDLCLVTLDSATQKHKLVWDNMQQVGIVAYRLYRQDNISSNYVLMHEQPIDSLSEYVDMLSNPQQTVSRYQIAAVDSCGTESPRYNTHTTVLLSSNQGINNTVNLSWNAYEGFEYPNFEIWRSADGISFTLLSNVPNNTFSFVDNNPLPQGFYQVRVSNPNGCVSSRSSDYNGSVSNVVDNQGNPAGIAAQQQIEASIYPNPSTGVFEVRLATSVTNLQYSVVDAAGRTILQGTATATNRLTLELGNYSSGIYALHLETPRGTSIKKLMLH